MIKSPSMDLQGSALGQYAWFVRPLPLMQYECVRTTCNSIKHAECVSSRARGGALPAGCSGSSDPRHAPTLQRHPCGKSALHRRALTFCSGEEAGDFMLGLRDASVIPRASPYSVMRTLSWNTVGNGG